MVRIRAIRAFCDQYGICLTRSAVLQGYLRSVASPIGAGYPELPGKEVCSGFEATGSPTGTK